MPYRKSPLEVGEVYHVFTRSIAGFTIFNSQYDYKRMQDVMFYYYAKNPPCRFSHFERKPSEISLPDYLGSFTIVPVVQVVAYCLMPTHIHLVMKEIEGGGITSYMNLILKSYAKFFNGKYKRKGPLWESRFKNVLVESDEQLIHLTRYVHLNPVSAELINKPDQWEYSSYKEYLQKSKNLAGFVRYDKLLDIKGYKAFVEDHIDYQRSLEHIKHLVVEEPY